MLLTRARTFVANGVLTQWCMVSEAQSDNALLPGFETCTMVISKLTALNTDDVG